MELKRFVCKKLLIMFISTRNSCTVGANQLERPVTISCFVAGTRSSVSAVAWAGGSTGDTFAHSMYTPLSVFTVILSEYFTLNYNLVY